MEQVNHIQKALNIPHEYIPLDSFEGEGGFFTIEKQKKSKNKIRSKDEIFLDGNYSLNGKPLIVSLSGTLIYKILNCHLK